MMSGAVRQVHPLITICVYTALTVHQALRSGVFRQVPPLDHGLWFSQAQDQAALPQQSKSLSKSETNKHQQTETMCDLLAKPIDWRYIGHHGMALVSSHHRPQTSIDGPFSQWRGSHWFEGATSHQGPKQPNKTIRHEAKKHKQPNNTKVDTVSPSTRVITDTSSTSRH